MPTRTALALAAGAVALGVASSLAGSEPRPLPIPWALVPATALGFLLPVRRFRARPVPLALVVVGVLSILRVGHVAAAAVVLAGWGLAVAVRHLVPDEPGLPDLLATLPTAVLLTGVADLAHAERLGPTVAATHEPVPALTLLAVWAVLLLGGPLWELALTRTDGGLTPGAWLDSVRSSWTTGAVLAATATLGGLVGDRFGIWTIALLAVPLVVAREGLGRLALAQQVHRQTIRAMSRLPEELGDVDRGHGERVAEAVVGVARVLGLRPGLVDAAEKAAHLHELGRIRWEAGHELTDEEVAAAGAGLVASAGDLALAARIVAAHRPDASTSALAGGPDDHEVRLAGRLVRLACDLDRGHGRAPLDRPRGSLASAPVPGPPGPTDAELATLLTPHLPTRQPTD
ncbi:MAG: hypothetical protein ACLGIR_12170 [Actinomycetes bacterium]